MMIFLSAIELAMGAVLILLPRFSTTAFLVVLEIYLSLLMAVKAIDAGIYAKARLWRRFIPALAGSCAGVELFFLILFAGTELREQAVSFAVGTLLMVFGAGQICDFLGFVVRSPRFRRVVSSIRLALPDAWGLLLTLRTADILPQEPLGPLPETGKEDFEVLFQVSAHGVALAGHCELCFDGYTLTYGAYDPDTYRFGKTTGDGILFRAPREPYLDWNIRVHRKKIISYTIRLDEAQAALVREQWRKLEDVLAPWEPQLGPKEFVTRLRKAVNGVSFYRVTEGPFRTYFIPTINCVTITNSLLERTEIGKALMLGIKTPGAYLDLLERQYRAGNGAVVSRRVYTTALSEASALSSAP